MVAAKKKKTDNQDMWGIIDEVEEKYTDLIDDLEGDDPHQHRHPKMKVTGMSVKQIPRLQETRRTAKKEKKSPTLRGRPPELRSGRSGARPGGEKK